MLVLNWSGNVLWWADKWRLLTNRDKWLQDYMTGSWVSPALHKWVGKLYCGTVVLLLWYCILNEVERRDCSHLSLQEFINCYARTHTPVIITGLVSQMTTVPWTLEHVRQWERTHTHTYTHTHTHTPTYFMAISLLFHGSFLKLFTPLKVAGSVVALLKKFVKRSIEWVGLELAEETSIADFIGNLNNSDQGTCTCSSQPNTIWKWVLGYIYILTLSALRYLFH